MSNDNLNREQIDRSVLAYVGRLSLENKESSRKVRLSKDSFKSFSRSLEGHIITSFQAYDGEAGEFVALNEDDFVASMAAIDGEMGPKLKAYLEAGRALKSYIAARREK